MKVLERLLQSSMLSSRWANRHHTMTWLDENDRVVDEDYVVVPDDEVICDDCNMCISNYPNAPIYVLQYSYDNGVTWEDSKALCSECANRYNLPIVVEEALLA
jgi:hypothetical protein